MENKPLVSICCTTYNHEKFIAQAIEGFLLQQTDFEFEIVIGEDCSTDSTAQIIKEYELKYPNKFRVYYNSPNIGVTPNWKQTLNACKGEFIAICEGDDYWTNPHKLSKQVSFLQNNPDFTVCFHCPIIYDELTNQFTEDSRVKELPDITTIDDLALANYIHSNTVVYRNNKEVLLQFNEIDTPIADFVFSMLNAKYGKIMKLDDAMAVYRIHNGGVWSGIAIEKRTAQSVTMLESMLPYFTQEIQEKILKQKAFILFELFINFMQNNEFLKSLEIYESLVPGPYMNEVKDILFKRITYLQKEVTSYKNSKYFTIKKFLVGRK